MFPDDRHLVRRCLEIEAGRKGTPPEGLLDAGIDDLEDDVVFLELDFRLGGVDVHVDAVRIHLQIQEIGRIQVLRHQVFIRFLDSLVQVGAAEIPPVYKEELVAQGLARRVRPAHKAAHAHDGGLGGDIHQLAGHGRPHQVLDAELQRLGLAQHKEVFLVMGKGKGNVRPRKGHTGKLLDDVLELHVVALEELAAGGHVVEEVAHRKRRPLGAGRLTGSQMLRGRKLHFHAHLVRGTARPEGHIGHRRDAGQGFTAESEGADGFQVFRRGDFGGRVALEAEHRVVRIHAAAVVDDLHQGAAGVQYHHGNLVRSGIHRIFQQFLHHRRRPLDHLARSDHVRHIPRKYPQFHYSRA